MVRLVAIASLLLALLGACSPNEGDVIPGEDFRKATDVIITSPTNGETVSSPFTLAYTAGEDVAQVRVEANGRVVAGPTSVDSSGTGTLTVALETGRAGLALVGLDAQGTTLSRHTLMIRIAAPADSWVTITSPSDGSIALNPVVFAADASDDIAVIELFSDGWSLGTLSPGGLLDYEFIGVGYERQIEAQGRDEAGVVVATDAIAVTVDPGTEPIESDFNAYVLAILATYPTDGSYGYYWPSSGSWAGTTRDIWYQGELMATGDSLDRSYCSGLTWETFMRAWVEVDLATGGDGTINGMTPSDLRTFRTDWYVRDLWGDGVGIAIDGYGIGELVTRWDDLRPGDFVQIWRHSGSGHTFVFIDWIRSGSSIIGVEYWSVQNSTDGIGYNEEYFGTSGSSLDPNSFFAARVYPPQDWVPWY